MKKEPPDVTDDMTDKMTEDMTQKNARRNHRKKSIENEFGESTTKEIKGPDENLLALESVGLVHKYLSELEEDDQYIIKLKYFKRLSYKEIADITGLSISNVGYRLHHIIKKLSKSLRRSGCQKN